MGDPWVVRLLICWNIYLSPTSFFSFGRITKLVLKTGGGPDPPIFPVALGFSDANIVFIVWVSSEFERTN